MAIDTSLPKDIRILQAAEEVFSQHGYEKATLDEIIALADVGKGTVYKYFGNKEHLFYKLVADKNAPFLEKLHQAVNSVDSFEEKLKKYFEVMVHFYVANSTLWQIICFEMLGGTNGCRVNSDGDGFKVVPRYNSVKLSEETIERILRYHKILHDEYDILAQLITKAMQDNLLKEDTVPEITTKFVFFGVAMSIFNQSDDIAADMTDEEAARIITDHFTRQRTLTRTTKNSCRLAAAVFTFVIAFRLLFLYVSGSNDTGIACVPVLVGIPFFTQFLVELVLRHGVVFYNFAFQMQATALNNRNADGLACFRS